MSEVFVQVGSGLAILLGLVHLASTKVALRDVTGLSIDSYRMVVMQWLGVGYLLLFLGAVPLASAYAWAFLRSRSNGSPARRIGRGAMVMSVFARERSAPVKSPNVAPARAA